MEDNKNRENKFEVELLKRIDRVIVNIKDVETRFDNLEKDVNQIKSDVKNISEIKSDVKIIKAQFSDVAVMAIEDNKRITKLEKDVEDLQSNIH